MMTQKSATKKIMTDSQLSGYIASKDSNQIKNYLLNFVKSGQYPEYSKSFNQIINDYEATPQLILPSCNAVLEYFSSSKDYGNAAKFLSKIIEYLQKTSSDVKPFLDTFISTCQNSKSYDILSQYYLRIPEPSLNESQDVQLEYFINLTEIFFQASDIDKSEQQLHKAFNHLFRASSNKDLVKRFDVIHARIEAYRHEYQTAARTYFELSKNYPEFFKSAAIYACMAPPSYERKRILSSIIHDDRSQKLSFYSMMIHIHTRQLIDHTELETFAKDAEQFEGYSSTQLKDSVRKNNLNSIAKLYKSISIKRLAEIVNAPIDEVTKMMRLMISNGDMKALIDQPKEMIYYFPEQTETEIQDQSILNYTREVEVCAEFIESRK